MIPKERAFSRAVYEKGIVPSPIEQLIFMYLYSICSWWLVTLITLNGSYQYLINMNLILYQSWTLMDMSIHTTSAAGNILFQNKIAVATHTSILPYSWASKFGHCLKTCQKFRSISSKFTSTLPQSIVWWLVFYYVYKLLKTRFIQWRWLRTPNIITEDINSVHGNMKDHHTTATFVQKSHPPTF